MLSPRVLDLLLLSLLPDYFRLGLLGLQFPALLMEPKLLKLLVLLHNGQAHQMVRYFHGHGPLGVVYIHKVPVLFGDLLSFSQNLFVVELGVVPALETERPASDF